MFENETLVAGAISFSLGLVASFLYFAGLAWTARRALASHMPAAWLLVSFLVRSALFIGLALLLMRYWNPVLVLSAWLFAFFLMRAVIFARTRRDAAGE